MEMNLDGDFKQTASEPRNLHSKTLCYDKPATTWTEALPVGNGHLGAMVYGRTDNELIQLNEDTVWYGGPQRRTPLNAANNLNHLRSLIRRNKHSEAEELVHTSFFASPRAMRHYEPFATLKLRFPAIGDVPQKYSRSLNLETGIVTTHYESNGVKWCRRVFASYPADAIVLQVQATKRSKTRIQLSRLGENEWDTNEFFDRIETNRKSLTMHFVPGGSLSNRCSCTLTALVNDSDTIECSGNTMNITSTSFTLLIQAETSFRLRKLLPTNSNGSTLKPLTDNIIFGHLKDYAPLFRSASLLFLVDTSVASSCTPTSQRLKQAPDYRLIELYLNFGRYLLISSSRIYSSEPRMSLPANLQGIWNPSFSPAWGSKFTININLQMNYWPCHTWNLSSLSDPLYFLLERMSVNGRRTARAMYGSQRNEAWCAHHNTDIWADTDPADEWMPSTLWPLGGAWLCLHIYERYEYEGTTDMLDGRPFLPRMFPVLQGAVAFVLDLLIEDDKGKYLIPSPGISPENSYWCISESRQRIKGILCEGSTMDIEIIHALMEHYLAAYQEIDTHFHNTHVTQDSTLRDEVRKAKSRLPPLTIGPDGRILEWQHPYEEPEPGHRHFSHLFPLYPGNSITLDSDPELAEACRKSIDARLESGGAHTGWSRAWLICLYARLRDAAKCWEHLQQLLKSSTLPNMFDNHPPMQIDGNFGGCAGILEMLLQSHEVNYPGDEDSPNKNCPVRLLRLLPACPVAWWKQGGSIKDFRARGGFVVSVDWSDRHYMSAVIATEGREAGRPILPSGETFEIPPKKGYWTLGWTGLRYTAHFKARGRHRDDPSKYSSGDSTDSSPWWEESSEEIARRLEEHH